jgi:predicted enzyme related to lactoylglutathione lyase
MQNDSGKFEGLRTVIYHVADLANAKEWYAKVLGVNPYFDQPFYVGFNIGGYELGLDPNGAPRGAGGAVAFWGVKEIESVAADLVSKGARLSSAVTDVDGGIKVATVLDPDGNVFGIIENPNFEI